MSHALGKDSPFAGPPGGERVASSSALRADFIGCPWAFRMGVEDMLGKVQLRVKKLARLRLRGAQSSRMMVFLYHAAEVHI